MSKTPKQLERYFKGVSNHNRIKILELIGNKKSLTLMEITELLDANIKTVSEHTSKLVKAGLVNKQYAGKYVIHTLSPYGESMVKLFDSFK